MSKEEGFIMANVTLHGDSNTSATSVSNVFIDEYMSDANGEFVKIYLYLLRQLNAADTAFSISAMADKFEHTEKDIKRALCYWERMHLLSLEYDSNENLTGIRMLDTPVKKTETVSKVEEISVTLITPASSATAENETANKQQAVTAAVPAKKSYSADEIKDFRQQEALAELLFITERYLGRVLTPTDINAILYWYDGLGFSTDLIEYLVEYCVSKGHTSIRYIEKVALAWAGDHIETVEQAKQASGLHNQTYFTVMKALGISGRNLVPSETAYIDKWQTDYGFSIEMISLACQRTMQAIHQPSFEYTDSILSSWKNNHVTSEADVARLDEAHQKKKKASVAISTAPSKNKFNNFEQRSYDYDQLEKMLLTTSAQ